MRPVDQQSRWQLMWSIFDDAINVAAEEREEFVQERCGSDDALANEVFELIAVDESDASDSWSRLRNKSSPMLGQATMVGQRLGSYTIVETIGSGGMGTVYKAIQDQPRRTVALKIVHPVFASSEAIRRFEYESEILGRLRHPNIADIYEAGIDKIIDLQVPFFAMEYVPGAQPLTTYLQEKMTPVRARLKAFLRVCSAIEHGHQKGIIHRDIKPGNVLIDSDGRIKVIDFGIARAVNGDLAIMSQRTQAGQLVGTLQYMSPEQYSSDPASLDTRSDVYALGVMLYEIIFDQLPYDLANVSIADAGRVVREQIVHCPAEYKDVVAIDLQTIILTALEKEPDHRYQSPAILAADITRFLEHRPIEARPSTPLYRARKFIKRNKLFVGSGLTIAAILISGTIVSMTFAIRENRATKDAIAAQKESDRQRLIADTVNDFFNRHVLAVASPTYLGPNATLADAVAFASLAAEKELRDQPEVAARVFSTLARVWLDLDQFDQAISLANRAIEQEAHADISATDKISPRSTIALATLYQRNFDEAIALLQVLVGQTAEAFGQKHVQVAVAKGNLGYAFVEAGQHDRGRRLLREVIDHFEVHDLYDWHVDEYLHVSNNYALTLDALELYDEAVTWRQETIEWIRAEHPAEQLHLMRQKSNLADTLRSMQHYEEAAILYQEAYELATNSTLPDVHRWQFTIANGYARTLEKLGRADEAGNMFCKAIELSKRVNGLPATVPLTLRNSYAMHLQRQGQFDSAAAQYKELLALADAEQELPALHRHVFRDNYGEVLIDAGEYELAEETLLESHAGLSDLLPTEHPRVQKSVGRLVRLYESSGNEAKARKWQQYLVESLDG